MFFLKVLYFIPRTQRLLLNVARRLIAFCTSVIVPAEVLDAVMAPAYNFHPGPPTYPGSHVASFAIYDGADMFGATAHEMAAKVDSGPIVGVEWFQVPDGLRFTDLEINAFDALGWTPLQYALTFSAVQEHFASQTASGRLRRASAAEAR